jgi:hypothetical protein
LCATTPHFDTHGSDWQDLVADDVLFDGPVQQARGKAEFVAEVAEVAEQLDASLEAVSSAHQRARATLYKRLHRETLMTLTAAQRRMLERYVAAWETNDLEMFVGLLAEDVVLSMPPMREWFARQSAVHGFFAWAWGPAGPGPFRLLPTHANAQPAFGLYGRALDGDGCTPQAIQVLTLEGERIGRLHGFVRPDLFPVFGLPARLRYAPWRTTSCSPNVSARPWRIGRTSKRSGCSVA